MIVHPILNILSNLKEHHMITPSPCYFHKVERKETWHFNVGKPVLIMEIFPNNEIKEIIMGNDILKIMNDE